MPSSGGLWNRLPDAFHASNIQRSCSRDDMAWAVIIDPLGEMKRFILEQTRL